jgi:hypothetical protein
MYPGNEGLNQRIVCIDFVEPRRLDRPLSRAAHALVDFLKAKPAP